MRSFFQYCLFFTILMIIISCDSTSQLYSYDNKNRNYTGQLSESDYTALKQILTNTASSKLKDTILIKYDYNNETCWNTLDQSDDDYIMGFITRHKQRVQNFLATRQNVSVFGFREPGNNLNKIIKWNNSIIIDSTKQLFKLLFKERCTCGSSIIAMPDKRFVFLRSDSHSEVFDLTQKQIDSLLNNK